jgi:tetratricopeptide (TPR) repeat protein
VPNEVISFYNNYSLLLHQTGDIELGKVILEKALAMAAKEIPDYQSLIEAKLSEYYYGKEDFVQAEFYSKAAISHTNKPFDRISRLIKLVSLYSQQNRWEEFNKTLSAVKRDYAQIKNVSDENIQYGVRLKLLESDYSLAQNNRSQAISKTNKAVALAFSYGS